MPCARAAATRTLEVLAEDVARGANALCSEDPSAGLMLISPSGDAAVDGARAHLQRLTTYGLDVGDVFEQTLETSRLARLLACAWPRALSADADARGP